MRNLGDHKGHKPDRNDDIRQELALLGVEIVEGEDVSGRLGPFTFKRAWTYYTVKGPVPLAVAEEMYADPVGRAAVRVAGHCAAPPPVAPWVRDGFVDSYDIDTEAGLRLFVDTVRKHGLDTVSGCKAATRG